MEKALQIFSFLDSDYFIHTIIFMKNLLVFLKYASNSTMNYPRSTDFTSTTRLISTLTNTGTSTTTITSPPTPSSKPSLLQNYTQLSSFKLSHPTAQLPETIYLNDQCKKPFDSGLYYLLLSHSAATLSDIDRMQHSFTTDTDFHFRADNTASITRINDDTRESYTIKLTNCDYTAKYVHHYLAFLREWYLISHQKSTNMIVIVRGTPSEDHEVNFHSSTVLPLEFLTTGPFGEFFTELFVTI